MSSQLSGTAVWPVSDIELDRLLAPTPSSSNPMPAASDDSVAIRQRINDEALDRIRRQARLHPELYPLLERLRPGLSRQATSEPSWLLDSNHPARLLLRRWLDSASGWQPELGRGADQLLRQWRQIFETLDPHSPTAHWLQADKTLEGHVRDEAERLARLEQRLHAAEQGHLKTRRVRAIAARILNQSLGGRPLPESMIDFIHNHWAQCIQQLLIRHGEHSEVTAVLTETSQQLVWSMQPQACSPEHRQQLYAVVPELASRIRKYLAQAMPDPDRVELAIAAIEALHLQQLQGEPLHLLPCPLIANDDPILSNCANVSKALLSQVEALHCGQWFWFADRDQRARLSLKLESTSQLLFVNALGARDVMYSFEEFAYRLSTGQVQVQPGGAVVDSILETLLKGAIDQAREQRQQDELARSQERERRAAALREQEASRRKALEEARQQAEREARAQAEAERAARALEQARRDQRLGALGDADQRERSARQLASMLEIGSWVEFFDPLGESQKLKLAVKLPSSGKMIFVDREGGNRLELSRADFIGRLAEGSATALEPGSAFDDTLARVVDGLRRDRGTRNA